MIPCLQFALELVHLPTFRAELEANSHRLPQDAHGHDSLFWKKILTKKQDIGCFMLLNIEIVVQFQDC